MSRFWEWLKQAYEFLKLAGTDVSRSLPDSLFFGTSLLALATQSYPLGILVLAMLELSLSQYLLGGLFKSVTPSYSQGESYLCRPGLPTPYAFKGEGDDYKNISFAGTLMRDVTFPSPSVWLLAGTIGYNWFSAVSFRKEINELSRKNPTWKTRLPLATVFSILLILIFILWRVQNSCDRVIPAFGTAVFAFFVGGLFVLFHTYLFGRDSVNFLGLPLLGDRAAAGRPLYVCASQN